MQTSTGFTINDVNSRIFSLNCKLWVFFLWTFIILGSTVPQSKVIKTLLYYGSAVLVIWLPVIIANVVLDRVFRISFPRWPNKVLEDTSFPWLEIETGELTAASKVLFKKVFSEEVIFYVCNGVDMKIIPTGGIIWEQDRVIYRFGGSLPPKETYIKKTRWG